MAAIEILGLEKTYMVGFWRKRPKRALQPLHLTVEEGEIFGFLGPNGAGKTTTLENADGAGVPDRRARLASWAAIGPILKSKRRSAFCPSSPISTTT